MNKLFMFAVLAAIAAVPAGVLGAPDKRFRDYRPYHDYRDRVKVRKERTVPEPATMLLVGVAAAGFAGARRLLGPKRS